MQQSVIDSHFLRKQDRMLITLKRASFLNGKGIGLRNIARKKRTDKFRRRILSETLSGPIAHKNPLFFTNFLQQFKFRPRFTSPLSF